MTKKQFRPFLAVLLIGAVYALWLELTQLYIPCPLRLFTGLACPGCGISHMCMDLLHLNFSAAVRENLAAAVLAPFWLAALVLEWLDKWPGLRKAVLWGSIALLLLFGAVRNLPGMEWLLPLYMQ